MKRILTSLVLIPVIVWTVLFAPYWAFLLVIVIIGGMAYREFDNIVAEHGIARAGWPGIVLGIAMLLASSENLVPNGWIAVMLIAIIGMIQSMRVPDLKDSLSCGAAFLLGILYIFGAWACAYQLRAINPHWLMFALLLSWAGDTAAYYTGRAIGRHKMTPRVSPAKSWEGAAGSVAGAMLIGLVYAHYLIPTASIAAVAGIAAIGNVAGQFGDLCESALKRGAGVKDSGTLLPGHGGWLDRIDSCLFSIPVVYSLVAIVYPRIF